MKVLVVGSGGREHAIIRQLLKSPQNPAVFCAPGNGGIAFDATCVPISATDINGMVAFARENSIDYVVVTPDDPLVLGMVDALQKVGIPAFGPNKAAAVIEGSKVFSKHLMQKYNIPTAQYHTFSDINKALEFLNSHTVFPLVIKADGLALGKGVLICNDKASAEEAVKSMMQDKQFGEAGSSIVIEEFLSGPEVSVLCFTDGKVIIPMVSSMDHKRALDGDKGLNTGGMGTVAPNPYYTQDIAKSCMDTIFVPTMAAMNKENRSFKGCLYFGLMLTEKGPKVIEYNCRFGDPETQVVLPLLSGDLLEIMTATTDGTLSNVQFSFTNKHAACIVMSSGGYPAAYQTGKEISGLTDGNISAGFKNVQVYHAGTKSGDANDTLYTSGGRVLGVTAVSDTLKKALDLAYTASDSITFEGAHRRLDIGKQALDATKS